MNLRDAVKQAMEETEADDVFVDRLDFDPGPTADDKPNAKFFVTRLAELLGLENPYA